MKKLLSRRKFAKLAVSAVALSALAPFIKHYLKAKSFSAKMSPLSTSVKPQIPAKMIYPDPFFELDHNNS